MNSAFRLTTLLLISILNFGSSFNVQAQIANDTQLYKIIMTRDSLLFNVGFNTCDITQFENLLSNDFQFYHDKDGAIPTKAGFVSNIKNGLCKSGTYQARRELIAGSIEIYPLYKNNELYGAIQSGLHRFYEKEAGKTEVAGSSARFTHVWLLENGSWKLGKGLSFDHQFPAVHQNRK